MPLCRGHHRQLHQAGNEAAWWENLKINALEIAKGLWEQTHPKSAAAEFATLAPPHDETNPIIPAWSSMSSVKQIEANRRNALKSTGPTTPEGKRRSRCNAVRHGLTAETVIAALEDSEDYEAFEAAVISDYDAESAVERELVLRLASVLWRLRRATGIETALFESVTGDSRKHEHRLSRENLGEAADLAERNRLFLGAATGIRRRGGKRAQLRFENGYRGLLLAPGRSAD